METLFPLGRTVITPAAKDSLHPQDVQTCPGRHAKGDWGELCEQDKGENAAALANGGRLFSVYHDRAAVKFFILTESDRSATTILLPEEY